MAYHTTQDERIEGKTVSDVLAEVARRFDRHTVLGDSIEQDRLEGAYLAERAEFMAFSRDDPDVSADEVDGLAGFARMIAEGEMKYEGYGPEVCRQASRLAVSAGVPEENVPR